MNMDELEEKFAPRYYKLDENKNVVPASQDEFLTILANNTIAKTRANGVIVSTVFLGLDHNFGNSGPPVVFETMIFNGENNGYQERYSSYEEAIKGHERAVAIAFPTNLKIDESFKL